MAYGSVNVPGKLTAAQVGAAAANHTHNYAGSGSAGGAANSAVKLSAAQTIDGVEFDGSAAIVHYGTCATAAATAAKTVALTGFKLVTGARVAVKFTYNNTAASPTLNVNSTEAKAIKKYGTTAPDTYMWQAGAVVEFVYDGTYWIMLGGTTASTTYYGVTKLSSSVSSTSTTLAATPSAVKQAYDLANEALPQSGGTVTGTLILGKGGGIVLDVPYTGDIYFKIRSGLISFEGYDASDRVLLSGIADPVADYHAATKKYVDDVCANISLNAADVGARPDTWVPQTYELFNTPKTLLGQSASASCTAATAVGYNANAAGSNSTALGDSANASGIQSVALGRNAKASSNYSVALGTLANASGSNSAAVGVGTCAASAAAAIGDRANAAYGAIAIGQLTKALSNAVALGSHSNAVAESAIAIGMESTANAASSIAVGPYANATARSAIALGESAKASGNHSTALGYSASTSNANSIQLGNASTLSSLTCLKSLTVTSDERDKTDITPIGNAVDFLNRVRAFSYVRNDRELYNKPEEELSEEEREAARKYGFTPYDREAHAAGTLKRERRRVGVSAQTVRQALIDTFGSADGADIVNDNLHDFDPAEVPDWVESHLGVTYEKFIPFLIRAVQELDARLKELEAQNA